MSLRLFARELLNDSFLQIDDLRSLEYRRELDELGPLIRQPYPELHFSSTSYHNSYETLNEWGYHLDEIELFKHQEDEHAVDLDISIKGKTRYDGGICLRLWIADKDGRIQNTKFPFDIEIDTAWSVATAMVAKLDIVDQDVTKIVDMIDGELPA
ncbi:hypothetical protein Gorai_002849 [Gossypium raimondii]|uniref:non-specific serine/threonine protein kinase n=1 Tax=Gossypium raimondii TaxID=29730 RepID=A0A7J8QMM6_GOSRA|nr:hypothetical protein [Gossypium raimondii]